MPGGTSSPARAQGHLSLFVYPAVAVVPPLAAAHPKEAALCWGRWREPADEAFGAQSELVAPREQRGSPWAGRGRGSPGSPGWRRAPLCWGDAGGASLPTGYRRSQDIELSWDVHFVHGGRWEKLRLGSCSHRDPLAGVGTAGAELPKPQGLFGVALEVQRPRALGNGSCTAELSLLLEQLPQPGAHLSCPPFTPASRSEDFPTTAGWSHP